MKYIIIFLVMIIFTSLVQAETTFFDNPDDAFIVSSSATGGVIITEEQQASGGYSGGCLYKWNCTDWSECLPSGKQIRNCTNIGTCSDRYKTPEIEQNCTYAPSSNDVKENRKLETKNKNDGNGIIDKGNIFIYFVIIMAISLIILYLKKVTNKKTPRLRKSLNA